MPRIPKEAKNEKSRRASTEVQRARAGEEAALMSTKSTTNISQEAAENPKQFGSQLSRDPREAAEE